MTTGGRSNTAENALYVADNVTYLPDGSIRSRYPFVDGDISDLPSEVFNGPIISYWDDATNQYNALTVCDNKLYIFDGEWTTATESDGVVAFDISQLTSYSQYGGIIVIADGVNPLAYFKIEDRTIVRPGDWITTNPDMALTGGATEDAPDYRAFYYISVVNDFGETPASGGGDILTPAKSVGISLADKNQPLGEWSTPVTINITNIPTAAQNGARVRLYRVVTPDFISPNITAYQLIKEFPVTDGATATITDDGTTIGRVIAPQLENSTGGLVARYVYELDGRIWAFGAGKEKQKIYYTGSAPQETEYPQFFTSDGGYFYVAYGSSYTPVTIRRGRADDGQICNFILCSGPDGQGRRFNILQLATQYGNQSVFQFYPSEQKGDEGAYSTFGVLDYMNSILYPSPGGFKSSGIRATYTNDNVTARIDDNIRDTVYNISYNDFNVMYGCIYEGKAMWHINQTQILVFDARNNGAWSIWTMPHDWFGTVSYGDTKAELYLVYSGKVSRYADVNTQYGRDTVGPEFPLSLQSGRIYASPNDGREWVRCLHNLFVFSELSGPIRITVRANTRKELISYTGIISADASIFSDTESEQTGGYAMEWSDAKIVPIDIHNGSWGKTSSWSAGPLSISHKPGSGMLELRVRVNKDINFLDWEIESLPGFSGLQLENFVMEYVGIGMGLDFSSRYNEIRVQTTRS
jgi:hypothetical protein